MDLKNKRVLVAGTGISGIGAVGLLMHTDADLILYDGNEKLSVAEIQSKLSGEKDIRIIIGELDDAVIRTLAESGNTDGCAFCQPHERCGSIHLGRTGACG